MVRLALTNVRFVPKADVAVHPLNEKPRHRPGLRLSSEVFNSTRSVPLYFANARRPHRGRHPIDYGEARSSAPSRGRTGRVGAGSRLEFVPIVCDPDVAGRINRHVGYHLDASALKNMDDIARLRAGRIARRCCPRLIAKRNGPTCCRPRRHRCRRCLSPTGCFRQGR